jgi:hypothetical protein
MSIPVVCGSQLLRCWQAAIVATAALMTFTLGCVVPFPAMAILAARTLSRRAAIATLLAAVFVNQAAAFLFLGYPRTLSTALWAPVFALATLSALAVAYRVRQPALALLGAFAAYQGVLALVTLAIEHSLAAFAPHIVAQVALGNLAGLALLGFIYLGLGLIERSATARDVRAAR